MTLDALFYSLVTSDRPSPTTMAHRQPKSTPPTSPTYKATAPMPLPSQNNDHQRLHRTYADIPEHHGPNSTDPIPTHGSPLSSRLHRHLEGIRAAISRESDLPQTATSSLPSSSHDMPGASAIPYQSPPRQSADSSEGSSWSPSKEATGSEWVRRRESHDGYENTDGEGKTWGWPGLGIFEERVAKKTEKAEGWGWPGLGWVEYQPRK
jgi:hypothetical protein